MAKNLQAELKAINDEMDALREKNTKKFLDILKRGFAECFEKFPELKSFSWTQYTPYFNDGDSCVFGVGEVDEVNEESIYECDEDGWQSEVAAAVNALINNVDQDIMEQQYGDHVRVIVKKRGNNFSTTTEEYEHE